MQNLVLQEFLKQKLGEVNNGPLEIIITLKEKETTQKGEHHKMGF